MSIITIHCRLITSEPVRRHLWHLMSEHNTPLVNDLLKRVSQHPSFEDWQRKGSIPAKVVKELCDLLRAVYPGQPGRFYASAILMVTYTYEAWLALQKKRRDRLDRKQRWLDVVKSDAELMELSGSSLEVIRERAQGILNQLHVEYKTPLAADHPKRNPKWRPAKRSGADIHLMGHLFAAYYATHDTVSRCDIAYLLKNGCKIPDTSEDPEKFAHRIHRKQKEIEQLEAQLCARLPKGRDLTGEEFLETLAIATQQISESVAQAQEWQAKLLTRPASLPYPIIYGSATDVRWGKTANDRIAVSFNGIDKYLKDADSVIKDWFKEHQEYPFRLYCDQRQLHFFQRFLEDWQAYQANKDTYPAGLLTLSSAMLAWRESDGNGDPWNINHLALYCSFDTRLMTAEGTRQVQQEKLAKTTNTLNSKADADALNEHQKKFYQRQASNLNRLANPPARPHKKSYQGKSELLIGISIGLANPITVAVVNGKTGEVLTYRTPRTLLGEQYNLFNRHRRQRQQNALQRHKNQQRGLTYQPSESELGQYVDRLLAKAVVQLARTYQAGSIVIPSLTHLRERLANEITARAEQSCPGSVEAQKQYAKEYRKNIHQWSYNRLIDAIQSKAQQLGIPVESGFQPIQSNPQEQAKDLAIAAYHARAIAK